MAILPVHIGNWVAIVARYLLMLSLSGHRIVARYRRRTTQLAELVQCVNHLFYRQVGIANCTRIVVNRSTLEYAESAQGIFSGDQGLGYYDALCHVLALVTGVELTIVCVPHHTVAGWQVENPTPASVDKAGASLLALNTDVVEDLLTRLYINDTVAKWFPTDAARDNVRRCAVVAYML